MGLKEPKYKYILEFPNKFRVYTNDERFLLNTLEKYSIRGPPKVHHENVRAKKMKRIETFMQPLKGQQCPECASTELMRDNEIAEITCMDCGYVVGAGEFAGVLDYFAQPDKPQYEIREDRKTYKILSGQHKNQATCSAVNRDTVERVYRYLKNDGKKRSASEIEKALHISVTTIHNALKVLRVQSRADFEIFGPKRKFLYKAL